MRIRNHIILFCVLTLGYSIETFTQAQTIAWQEDWESPTAQDNWFSDFGFWEIGVPTSGPGGAHQGSNVAATVLNGNYSDDRESRLITATRIRIPMENPRLRFWHWWNFNDSDYAEIQISINNAISWEPLSPRYGDASPANLDSSGHWTQAWLDLTPYAGRMVQFGLYFRSQNGPTGGSLNVDVDPGWYVDEFTVESGPLENFIPSDHFDEDAAMDRWHADFGVWEIGAPTSGPGSAHSGENCLATILAGNYTDDRSSLISSGSYTLPPADQKPRLRFWHWWNFNDSDYGEVQISTDKGITWAPISPRFGDASPANLDSSGKWTQAWLDLSPYAGQTVQFGFYFSSLNGATGGSLNTDVDPGWYVDDFVVESGPQELFIPSDNFEDDAALDRWHADLGVWEIGAPTSGPGSAHSGENCLATILSGNYTDDRSSFVSSASYTLPSSDQNPRLRFWHWWNFNDSDYGEVQISTDQGLTWVPISPRFGDASFRNLDSSGQWTQTWLDLSPYAGQTVQFGFYFSSLNGPTGGSLNTDVDPGWYVDDFVVESGPQELFIPSDNFEDDAALDRWQADFGVWEIGTPTSGPGSAHDGTKCLATILSGNYTDDRRSRIVSEPLGVPPADTFPRLAFWHWWNFNDSDSGQVQISIDDGANWEVLATYELSNSWTRPQLSLVPYAGQTVRLGFFFYSQNGPTGGSLNVDVAPGWYIDQVRLLHDPALLLAGSPIVLTQETGCVSLQIAVNAPTSGATFILQTTGGNLSSLELMTQGCWTGTLSQQSANHWAINLQSTCLNGSPGVQTIGTLCFTSISSHSAFVPLTVQDLVINDLGPAYSVGTRSVNIAGEPLLEAWLDSTGQRMATLFGLENQTYEIHYTSTFETPSNWTLGWTQTVPISRFTPFPVTDDALTAPTLFLRANEP